MIKETCEDELGKLFEICHSNLKRSKQCQEYLFDTRKMSRSILKEYRIGYFPQNIKKLTSYVSETTLQKLSILEYSGNSSFKDHYFLIFPYYSERSRPIGIAGRTLMNDEERNYLSLSKYKNSSFKKANYLYGLNLSKSAILKEQNVFIVEGYFDQIALHSNQIKNSVAICGTAFSKNHFLKLARYTDKLSFILDRDDSGKKAMEKIYQKYSNHGIKLRFKMVPDNCKDVDDYFRKGGSAAFFESDFENFIPGWVE